MYSFEEVPLRCTQDNFIRLLERNFSGLKDTEEYKSLYNYLTNDFELALRRGPVPPKKSTHNLRETVYHKFVQLYIKGGLYDATVKRKLILEMLQVNYDYTPSLNFKQILEFQTDDLTRCEADELIKFKKLCNVEKQLFTHKINEKVQTDGESTQSGISSIQHSNIRYTSDPENSEFFYEGEVSSSNQKSSYDWPLEAKGFHRKFLANQGNYKQLTNNPDENGDTIIDKIFKDFIIFSAQEDKPEIKIKEVIFEEWKKEYFPKNFKMQPRTFSENYKKLFMDHTLKYCASNGWISQRHINGWFKMKCLFPSNFHEIESIEQKKKIFDQINDDIFLKVHAYQMDSDKELQVENAGELAQFVNDGAQDYSDTWDAQPSSRSYSNQVDNYDDDESWYAQPSSRSYSKSSKKLKIKEHKRKHKKSHRKKKNVCLLREGMLTKRIRWLDNRVDKLEHLLCELLEEKNHKLLEKRVNKMEDLLHDYLEEDMVSSNDYEYY